ncbi:sensor histidine kinase [Chryseobacterium arachidis]|nr:histidine kinase [Chryseobacterium arachidis]
MCIPASIYIWLSVNYFQFVILHYFGIDIHEGALKEIISKNAKQPYFKAISYQNVFGNAMLVIYSFSPPFFVKILFDISRLFNRTIYFQKQTLDLKLQNLNIEKDFLKAQLNPHFLFNTLNNLYGLVVKKDPSAPEAIINISDLMAYTLYESNTEKVPVQKEIDFIQNYFYLERMRYSADKDITLEISVEDDIDNIQIAPLLSFTFIENAFKYGLKSAENNFLKISIDIVNNIFYFAIENNKEKNSVKKTSFGGIGVKNVEKRLNLIYPDNHELITEDRESSFFVSLSINLT